MTEDTTPEIGKESLRRFEKTEAQLEGFFEEIGNLSKKKPDDAVNPFKLGFINQMLERANELLGDDYRPFLNFTTFDVEATVPTTSDVVTMLSQYLRSMDKFRKDHTYRELSSYYWNVRDDGNKHRAREPKDFR